MNLEDVLSEINQKQKDRYCMILFIPRMVKFMETESKMVFSGGCRERGMKGYCLMGIEFQFCR